MTFDSTTRTVALAAVPETRVSRRTFGRMLAGLSAATLGVATTNVSATPGFVDERPTQKPTDSSVADTASDTDAAPAASGGSGIAGFAMQFVGYPYVYGGNTPAGFDCSGFTQYVILNTLGIDIGHGTGGQMGFGAPVSGDALLPGDLVFFAGTFGDGISHAAVYIGDGMMVHAENEGTGVCVSALWSDYYAAHYAGATRLW